MWIFSVVPMVLLTPRNIQRNFGINPTKSPSYISTKKHFLCLRRIPASMTGRHAAEIEDSSSESVPLAQNDDNNILEQKEEEEAESKEVVS
jgi:hypothetical protein